MIPFNKPYLTGKEMHYMYKAIYAGKISGNGEFTQKCQKYFEESFGIGKALLTTSCTDALEMAAILCDIQPGDEVILPSYTFVSTANAFVLRGAKLIFVDSREDHPGMDESQIESLITDRTKVIVPVHYAGVACDMEKIMNLANKYNLLVVEDAAQAIDSYFTFSNGEKKSLGSIGHLAAFSFHETKNIISGEGGLLAINDSRFMDRAEIIWEKGTNRSAFFRGEVDKYGWVDIGSSFLASDIIASFLFAQLENLGDIQKRRLDIWQKYDNALGHLNSKFKSPIIPEFASNNAHMYYIVFPSLFDRSNFINYMRQNEIMTAFHYLSLHKSPFYVDKYLGGNLPLTDKYSDCLLRLPFFYELNEDNVIDKIVSYFSN